MYISDHRTRAICGVVVKASYPYIKLFLPNQEDEQSNYIRSSPLENINFYVVKVVNISKICIDTDDKLAFVLIPIASCRTLIQSLNFNAI